MSDDGEEIVFKKRTQKGRGRQRAGNDNQVGTAAAQNVDPSDSIRDETEEPLTLIKKSNSTSSAKGSSKLSFAEPEDTSEDILELKKSWKNRDKKKAMQRDVIAEAPQRPSSSAYSSTGDDYTPEKLAQLRSKNVFAQLKPLQKQADETVSALGLVENQSNDDNLDIDGEPQAAQPTSVGNGYNYDGESVGVNLDDDEEGEAVYGRGAVPSESDIAKIRAKRERMRLYGTAAVAGGDGALQRDEEFISLHGNKKDDDELPDDSRLVRESKYDDDDAELTFALGQDYTGSRVQFGDPGKYGGISSSEKQTVAGMLEDEDDDIVRWELEQIRNSGLKKGKAQEVAAASIAKRKLAGKKGGIEPKPYVIAPAAAAELSFPSLEDILRKMTIDLSDKESVHSQNKMQLERVNGNIVDTEKELKAAIDEQKELNETYPYFKELKNYIFDITDCVGEKLPEIEVLEREMLHARIERFKALNYTRAQYLNDEIDEVKEIMSETMLPPAARQDRDARLYGREAARQRRVARRQQRNTQDPEGWSSNDEADDAPDAYQQYQTTKQDILGRCSLIFEDVYEEFSDVRAIARRFEEWKQKYPKEYKQAYVGMSLPDLFAPFVRMELLDWEPLDYPRIDDMNWYRILADYGVQDDQAMEVDGEGPDYDSQLVPAIVEKTVAPIVRTTLSYYWDIDSGSQCTRAIDLVQELLVYVDKSKLRDLVSQIEVSFQAASDKTMLLVPKEKFWTNDHVMAVVRKTFNRSVKLIRNLLMWSPVLSLDAIFRTTMDHINNRIIPYLRNVPSTDAVAGLEEVLRILPREWILGHKSINLMALLHDYATNGLVRRLRDEIDTYLNGGYVHKIDEAQRILARLVAQIRLFGGEDADNASKIASHYGLSS